MGMSRQNYYKQRRVRHKHAIDEELVLALVRRERSDHPRMGGRKLHRLLNGELREAGVEIGRDRMFDVLRGKGLLVTSVPKAPRTTDSKHALPVFRNLVKDLTPTAPNQIWVSDLTYLRTDEGFVYLAVIMDLYSRKIVGHHCGDSLEALGCVRALQKAIKDLPANRHPIHHSDRGCQYCCHEYVGHLKARNMPVSMTEQNHCYENAYAERVQGILKQEYSLRLTFRHRDQARRAAEEAIWLYNNRRPHTSLGFRRPAQVHQQGDLTVESGGREKTPQPPQELPRETENMEPICVNF
jgi:transposase InsO family protein